MIVVTHYQRLLNYIVPDFVHVLAEGRIVKSGGKELALELEENGYAGLGIDDEEEVGMSVVADRPANGWRSSPNKPCSALDAELREAAFQRFAELGFPTTHDEEWRFTNVAPIARTRVCARDLGPAGHGRAGRTGGKSGRNTWVGKLRFDFAITPSWR